MRRFPEQAMNSSDSDQEDGRKWQTRQEFKASTPQEEKLKQILKRNEFKEKILRHHQGKGESRMGERNYSIPLMLNGKEDMDMDQVSQREKRKSDQEGLLTNSQVYEYLRRQKPYSKKQK